MNRQIVEFIKNIYANEYPVLLHRPIFIGNEKEYMAKCIDTSYVSYVGEFVNKFEKMVAEFTGAKYAVATVNGTSALHISLKLAGVKEGDEVLTQALTFVATVNAISYCGAKPIFVDSDMNNLGMSAEKLEQFLRNETVIGDDGFCHNKTTGRRIVSCVPVHIFGHSVRIDKICEICNKYNILVIEDSAESLGSYYKGQHTGTFGIIGVLSFNGNKVITTGGGGMILTNDEELAKRAKHITTTAKIPHKWEFDHDEIGFNYRMPNINAAVGCAQMENIQLFLKDKREISCLYREFFNSINLGYVGEPEFCQSNYWLNAILVKDVEQRGHLLEYTNKEGVMTRPVWILMNKLAMYKNAQTTNLENAKWLEARIVNIPSSVRMV